MTKRALLYLVLTVVCIRVSVSAAQSPVLSADVGIVASMIEKDFQSVDSIRTISMSDDQNGRFDFVVIGRKPHDLGWRVEILSATRHHVSRLWDSTVSATEPEYSMSGPKNISIQVKDYDYDVQLEGCAPHLCSNGVSGFLIFNGKEERTVKARVMSMDLNKVFTSTPKFDVQFSQNADEQSKTALMRMICQSSAIQNREGLPFVCRNPQLHTSHSPGKERDAESGLDYFGARYYGSRMGRFMSPHWSAQAEPVPYAKLGDGLPGGICTSLSDRDWYKFRRADQD